MARCPDWSSLSELTPKTNYITVILKKGRKRWSHGRLHQRKHVSYTHTHTHTHTHTYIYIDGRPIRKVLFDQPWEKELSESESDFRSVERTKNTATKKGKAFRKPAPPTCYQPSRDVNTPTLITLCGGEMLEPNAEEVICCNWDGRPLSSSVVTSAVMSWRRWPNAQKPKKKVQHANGNIWCCYVSMPSLLPDVALEANSSHWLFIWWHLEHV